MNQQDSTLIRITRKLKAQLEELGQLWATRWMKGDMTVPAPDDRGYVSMERVIAALLARDSDHRKRSRKNSGRKTTADDQETQSGVGTVYERPVDL